MARHGIKVEIIVVPGPADIMIVSFHKRGDIGDFKAEILAEETRASEEEILTEVLTEEIEILTEDTPHLTEKIGGFILHRQ